MGTSALLVAVIAVSTAGASIPRGAIEKQNELFQRFWGVPFEWKYEALPEKGQVREGQIPYSGYIYPDRGGGTASALRKYDMAFHRGRYSATSWENWDTTAYKKPKRRGLFGLRVVMETPSWHGHCNGWAAAAIRHAEPQKSVTINGVTFSPADIKGLLAELYIYNDLQNLAGVDYPMNAGLFHAVITNWVGRGQHGLGMEADPGEEKWNYPIYGYASSSAMRRRNQVEVKLNLAYAKDSNGEYDESPRIQRVKYFHYMLELNGQGDIIGGYFFRDSSFIDMLWVPVRPKPAGQPGNESGNPHVTVENIMSIWRASVPEEVRKHWVVIDPLPEDRLADTDDLEGLLPVQDFSQSHQIASADVAEATDEGTTVSDSESTEAEEEDEIHPEPPPRPLADDTNTAEPPDSTVPAD